MKDKKTIGMVLLGLGALLWLQQRSSGGGARRYRLPDGRTVTEDMLPQLGYVYYQGYWIPQHRLNQVTNSGYSAADWQRIINSGFSVVNAGAQLWQAIQNAFQRDDFRDLILTPTYGPPGSDGQGWV